MIIGLQIVSVLFGLVMIYFALINYKKKDISKVEYFSWIVIWIFTIIIVIFPTILREFSKHFFVTRLFDLLVVGGFILVIFMVSKAYLSTKRVEKIMEDLIRITALNGKTTKKTSKKY